MTHREAPAIGTRSNKLRRASDADKAFLAALGLRLLQARTERKIARATIAAQARCSETTVANVEQGRHAPDVVILRGIAEALDLRLGTLLADL